MKLEKELKRDIYLNRLKLGHDKKIEISISRIKQFYEELKGNVYISFSGGLDSTVMLHLVRNIYPDILAVRVIEPSYIELNKFIKEFDNVIQLKPDKSFYEIIKQYGYPIISKEISKNISRYRNSNDEYVRKYRLYGIRKDGTKGKIGVIPNKFHYLVDAPFKISDRCCDIIKKKPINKFEKEKGLKPFVGIKAIDSNRRFQIILNKGCNSFIKKKEISYPLAFWNKYNIWRYIRDNKIEYCSLYDKGENNLGCIFCLFGIHLDKKPNRIQRMYHLNRNSYNYCLNKLEFKKVLNFIGINFKPIEKLDSFIN